MHFFVARLLSIAVMTYIYICHLRNLRLMIRLICYAHSLILPETRVPVEDLHNLMQNSQSESFKVMHFGITEKPMTNYISQYNNAGLISNVPKKIASENAEIAVLNN